GPDVRLRLRRRWRCRRRRGRIDRRRIVEHHRRLLGRRRQRRGLRRHQLLDRRRLGRLRRRRRRRRGRRWRFDDHHAGGVIILPLGLRRRGGSQQQEQRGGVDRHHEGETGDSRPVQTFVFVVLVGLRQAFGHALNSSLAGRRASGFVSYPLPAFRRRELTSLYQSAGAIPTGFHRDEGSIAPRKNALGLVRILDALVKCRLGCLLGFRHTTFVGKQLGEVEPGLAGGRQRGRLLVGADGLGQLLRLAEVVRLRQRHVGLVVGLEDALLQSLVDDLDRLRLGVVEAQVGGHQVAVFTLLGELALGAQRLVHGRGLVVL